MSIIPRRRLPRSAPAPQTPKVRSLTEALEEIHLVDCDSENYHGHIDEIVVRVAGYHPRCYQAMVKFRDRSRAWAVSVDTAPEAALTRALDIALRGQEAVLKESTVLFYHHKQEAADHGARLKAEFEIIEAVSVEFEPYFGYVAVAHIDKDASLEAARAQFGLRAEVRYIETSPTHIRRRRTEDGLVHQAKAGGSAGTTTGGAPSKAPKGKLAPTPKAAVSGQKSRGSQSIPAGTIPDRGTMEEMKKSALIKLHQDLYGKQPNNKLNPTEIIDLILSKADTLPATTPFGDLDGAELL